MASVTRKISNNGQELTITINGNFNFPVQKGFREAYSDLEVEGVKITIDLHGVEYMDSSALGMMLLLRERSGGEKADISLTGCNQAIQEVLDISRFGTLFNITG